MAATDLSGAAQHTRTGLYEEAFEWSSQSSLVRNKGIITSSRNGLVEVWEAELSGGVRGLLVIVTVPSKFISILIYIMQLVAKGTAAWFFQWELTALCGVKWYGAFRLGNILFLSVIRYNY